MIHSSQLICFGYATDCDAARDPARTKGQRYFYTNNSFYHPLVVLEAAPPVEDVGLAQQVFLRDLEPRIIRVFVISAICS